MLQTKRHALRIKGHTIVMKYSWYTLFVKYSKTIFPIRITFLARRHGNTDILNILTDTYVYAYIIYVSLK